MKIIDKNHLLSPLECAFLLSHASKPFNMEGFASLDDILTKLNVNVIIEQGIFTRLIPSFLGEAFRFWKDRATCIKKEMEETSEKKKEVLEKELYKVFGIIQHIQGDIANWPSMSLRGLYDPDMNVIKLYPEEMRQEYAGAYMDELLVSTLAHETMHAYFNRPGHKFAYIPTAEEPLAEFGMLLYLNDTGSSYYNWAVDDVRGKHTCYKYGADIMDQYLTESSSSPTRQFLEAYKIKLAYPVIMGVKSRGLVLCTPKKKGLGVDETPIGKGRIREKLSLPIVPPPLPISSTVGATGTIVVQDKCLRQFVLEVFIFLEGRVLLDNLPIKDNKNAKYRKTITNVYDFVLPGILWDTAILPVDTDYSRMFDGFPFVIKKNTYYLSNQWGDGGTTPLQFKEFVEMIKHVYSGQFDIQKVAGMFIMIEF